MILAMPVTRDGPCPMYMSMSICSHHGYALFVRRRPFYGRAAIPLPVGTFLEPGYLDPAAAPACCAVVQGGARMSRHVPTVPPYRRFRVLNVNCGVLGHGPMGPCAAI